jgi:hypothetical protein
VIVGDPAERAREMIVFCDGFDEGGLYPEFTRRARLVARDLLEVLDLLGAERSARVALQQRIDGLLARQHLELAQVRGSRR